MFTNAEIEALKFYSTDGYRAINEFLRGERLRTVEVARHVESLDSALVKSRLESDMVLFEGLTPTSRNLFSPICALGRP